MSQEIMKEIGKGSFWSLIASISVKVMAFLYLIFLARFLAPEEIGLFNLVFSILAIVMLFTDAGICTAIIRYVPFYMDKGKKKLAKGVFKYSLIFVFFFSLFLSILFFLSANLIADYFQNKELIPLLYLASLYIFLTGFLQTGSSFLNGLKKMKMLSIISILSEGLKVLLTIIFVFYLGATALNLFLGFVIGLITAMAIGFFYAFRYYKQIKFVPEYNWSLFKKDILPFSSVMLLVTSIILLISYIDKIMLGKLLLNNFSSNIVAEMVGHYSIAFSLAQIMVVPVAIIGAILLPVLSGLVAQKKKKKVQDTSERVIYWLVLLSVPIFLLFLAFPSQLLTIPFTDVYARDAGILIIATVSYFIYLFGWVQSVYFIANGQNKINLIVVGFAAIVNIILNFILIPIYALEGAAIASACAFAVMSAGFIYFGYKKLGFSLPKKIYKPFIAGIFMLIALFLLKPYLIEILRTWIPQVMSTSNGISALFEKLAKMCFLGIVALLSSFIYLICLILLKAFSEEDVELLAGALKKAKVSAKLIHLFEKVLLYRIKL